MTRPGVSKRWPWAEVTCHLVLQNEALLEMATLAHVQGQWRSGAVTESELSYPARDSDHLLAPH